MLSRSVQLVLHFDGAGFSGWQRQPNERTVQGELEAAVSRLCGTPIAVVGAGRTDAGVHARGQAAGLRVPDKWSALALRRSMNAILPDLSLIHISEPTRLGMISYAVFCLKKKKKTV